MLSGPVSPQGEAAVNFSKLSREDWMVGGGGLVLIVGLLVFPWFSDTVFGYAYSTEATDGPGMGWAVIAVVILFGVVLDLGLARFSPVTTVPSTKYGRELTRAFAVALIVVLMVIRVLWHVGDWGWGFYVDLILLAVVAVGAWFNALGRATPVGTRQTP
jgi:hypothetical protein